MTDRYVVSARTAGLGDRIISLAAAWRFARATRRILIADWRRSRYAGAQENLFPLCFENKDDIASVPIIADDRVDRLLPRSRYRAISRWIPFRRPRAAMDGETAVKLILSGKDIEPPIAVFDTCINHALVSFDDARAFLGALRPVAHVAAAVAAFEEQRLQSGPWIGLHIRHGNGGDIMNHAPFWTSFDLAIERCARAVEKARERLGPQALVLLCTDSVEVQSAILKRIPRVVCRPKWFRQPGGGELHLGSDAALGRDDALIEMLLLARCSILIRYPFGSFFSFYAAVMKPRRLPPPATIWELEASHDPDDRLGAAVLF